MFKNTILVFFVFFMSYTLSAQSWKQVGQDIDGEAAFDGSGRSVSLSSDGSTVAIGAPNNSGNGSQSGHVRVFKNINGTWTQIGSDIDGEAAGDNSGLYVSLSSDGSIVAIGAYRNGGNGTQAGHVRIYKNISGTWTQQGADIDGEAANDFSGLSVSLSSDGSTVAIGAYGNDGNGTDAGHVRIYKNISGTWTQVGSDIDGEAAGDRSGGSVSLSSDGSIVAVGAQNNDGNGSDAGHVRVYKNTSGTWTQVGSDIDGEAAGDLSGYSVSLSSDGSTVAIGAYGNDGNGSNAGHARIYKNVSGTWTQVGSDIDGEAAGDRSGRSVSLSSDGSIVAVGAHYNDGNGFASGHVRTYQNTNGAWTQIGPDVDGEAVGDESGNWGVSLSSDGTILAIGATSNDGNGNRAGHTRMYEQCEVDSSIDHISACVAYTWTNGVTYTESNNTATDNFVNETGCDSIVTLDLVILNATNSTDEQSSCSSYTWSNGITYTESNNTATDTFLNAAGCDSIVTLSLVILSDTTAIDEISACGSYTWTNGVMYVESNNTAKDTFVNVAGCDSIIALNLVILSGSNSIDEVSTCDSYIWTNGVTYTESNNTATDTFVNAAGCDSIVTLNLVVNNTFISDQPMDLNIVQSSNAEFNVVTTKTGLTFQWQTDMGTGFQTITNAGQYSGTQTATLTVSSVATTNDNQKFRCIVSDGDCIDTSEIATLTIGKADVPERSLTKDFTVYPNPTEDVVFISTKASFTGTSYTIYSSSGALIRNGSITSEITTLDIQDLQEGIYFIQLGDNIQQSFKFIKQ